ncbi:cytochrome aa3 quinol oxidase subunit 3 [Marinococcus luteus]|jgi:cytochrome aa3-600 menaquinol oxidase subunit III|uniref:Quinol oxidase subunit 3 n=1 Tax=Marinococcus luteus TaxID=1122204 RepID=A0A1H2T5G0_9BACI|nr:cytochrome aa3 quinol oxidase subunit III [Marinococcus luteus]SDW39166.1 cytochrome aa3 quinol oxidase subunit 3 [Marinococcus luteus]
MSEHAELKTGPLEYRKEEGTLTILGFWIFLAAEVVLFSTLFATYAVLFGRYGDATPAPELFEMPIALAMTFLLLTSSFTCGIAIHMMRKESLKGLLIWLSITLALGLGFLGFEIYEFVHYVHEGASIQSSAFWSAFFTLTGTHGLHVTLGIAWCLLIIIQLVRVGLTPTTARKTFVIGLYWHFLDVVWIFIFTAVYLIGMVV